MLSLFYDFRLGVADNGNVAAITNNRDSSRSESFTYDGLNRVATAESAATSGSNCWGEQFGYDPWGNLLSRSATADRQGTGCTYESLSVTVTPTGGSASKNQIVGYCYDAAGNLLGQINCATYVYDNENRLSSTAGVSYTYDGDGKRVAKSTGKLYWTGVGSDPLDESDASGNFNEEYVFFNGKRIARADVANNAITAVHYYFSDHLGSADVVTSATGAIEQESDYYPFGGERAILTGPNTYKFTGKERDGESGLDEFGARYYSSPLGRFTIPDWAATPISVPYADFGDPQSLNLYAYVRNNPLARADLDGHCGSAWGCIERLVQAIGRQEQRVVAASNGHGKVVGTYMRGVAHVQAATAKFLLRSSPMSAGAATGACMDGCSSGKKVVAAVQDAGNVLAVAGALFGASSAIPRATSQVTTAEQLQAAANRAAATVGPGSGPAYGTAVHTEFAAEVKALGNPNLTSEQSYLSQSTATYGTSGSVRPDVVEGPVENPTAAYDLKTGSATLTPSRVQQIQSELPGGTSVPVRQIKPKIGGGD